MWVKFRAKEGIKSRPTISDYKESVPDLRRQVSELEKELNQLKSKGVTDQMRYLEAMRRAPLRMAETMADIKRKPPEQTQERGQQHKTTTRGQEL